MRISALFLIFALMSSVTAFEVTPLTPNLGEGVTIAGVAAPGEEVRLRSSFEMNLPVDNGKYEYVATGVEIPQKPNKLSVVAKNVDDLNVGVKMGIWVTMPVSASGGVASISKSDIPPGRYNLKMFGDALPGAAAVSIRVDAETTVRSGTDGEYELVMDTSGVPAGEYKIRVAGDEKVVIIGQAPDETSRSRSEPSEASGGEPSARTVGGSLSAAEREEKEEEGLKLAIPDPYYLEMKKADADNPDDIVRYISTARNRAIDLDVFEKAAFYEHFLKGCGFNVSFAYTENFDDKGRDHLWLLVTTRKGEAIEVDPSYRDAGGSSLLPLDPEYSRYDERFMDVYEASDRLGVERLAWWTDETAWGSRLAEVRPGVETQVNVSTDSVEDKGFISRILDRLMRAFGKVGLAV